MTGVIESQAKQGRKSEAPSANMRRITPSAHPPYFAAALRASQ
jgi:hypothetical protein